MTDVRLMTSIGRWLGEQGTALSPGTGSALANTLGDAATGGPETAVLSALRAITAAGPAHSAAQLLGAQAPSNWSGLGNPWDGIKQLGSWIGEGLWSLTMLGCTPDYDTYPNVYVYNDTSAPDGPTVGDASGDTLIAPDEVIHIDMDDDRDGATDRPDGRETTNPDADAADGSDVDATDSGDDGMDADAAEVEAEIEDGDGEDGGDDGNLVGDGNDGGDDGDTGVCIPSEPPTELCDGIDNDCNQQLDDVEGLIDPDGNPIPCTLEFTNDLGVCTSAGVMICDPKQSTLPVCNAPILYASTEVCDNIDNNCNGTPDDIPGKDQPCDNGQKGACFEEGIFVCDTDLQLLVCSAPVKLGTEEICNGADDDCDGKNDEDLSGVGGTCNNGQLGKCYTEGLIFCNSLKQALNCSAPQVTPDELETCNGVDDDCDGGIDTFANGTPLFVACDDPSNPLCAGIRICVNGSFGACETAPKTTPEICDGVDNNCDGNVDKDADGVALTTTYGTNVGECQKGTKVCVNGGWKITTPAKEPQVETCTNEDADDNCDGIEDNVSGLYDAQGTPKECTQTVDACVNFGVMSCFPSLSAEPLCTAILPIPGPEVCDGEDNDCNGIIDDVTGVNTTCELKTKNQYGTCITSGILVCKLGAGTLPVCDAPLITPAAEVCDGIDNDCDGTPDDVPGVDAPCDNGQLGVCLTAGTMVCETELQLLACSAPSKVGTTELCNTFDDDCDGATDEGPDGAPVLAQSCGTTSTPPCSLGTELCIDGQWIGCNAVLPATETCNNQDDDCDGQIDDGVTQACGPEATVGICQPGFETCVAGAWQNCTAIFPAPYEICTDTADDTCNGITNDGCPTCEVSNPAPTLISGQNVSIDYTFASASAFLCKGSIIPVNSPESKTFPLAFAPKCDDPDQPCTETVTCQVKGTEAVAKQIVDCPTVTFTILPDPDKDGLPSAQDNCPQAKNVDQADWNSNGIGDACDDSDDDGVVDAKDNCLTVSNPGQENDDGNGTSVEIGNACTPLCSTPTPKLSIPVNQSIDTIVNVSGAITLVCNAGETKVLEASVDPATGSTAVPLQQGPLTSSVTYLCTAVGGPVGFAPETTCSVDVTVLPDNDADGVPDASDNCPTVVNALQEDGNTDGVGDVCTPLCSTPKTKLTILEHQSIDTVINVSGALTLSCAANDVPLFETSVDPTQGSTAVPLTEGPLSSTVTYLCTAQGGPVGFAPNTTCSVAVTVIPDDDADGVPDASDNCPTVVNPQQEDGNKNGVGDACTPLCSTPTPNITIPAGGSIATVVNVSGALQLTCDAGTTQVLKTSVDPTTGSTSVPFNQGPISSSVTYLCTAHGGATGFAPNTTCSVNVNVQ